eukprot:5036459-Amphidinium_carterae.1
MRAHSPVVVADKNEQVAADMSAFLETVLKTNNPSKMCPLGKPDEASAFSVRNKTAKRQVVMIESEGDFVKKVMGDNSSCSAALR